MKTFTVSSVLLAVVAGAALAQQPAFQLPRECSERHNVDQSKCVIQDGQPSYPWVHKVQPVAPTTVVPAPSAAGAAAGLASGRKASR